MKKILACILCIVLLCTVLPLGAVSVSAATFGTCGASVAWNYNTSTATLTISGTGAMTNYSFSNIGNFTYVTTAPWREYYNTMKTVVIGTGVTAIGNSAFRGCTGLTSVTIGNSVTTIGNRAFYGCSGLTEIHWNAKTVGDFTYYWEEEGYCLGHGCLHDTTIYYPICSNVFFDAGNGGAGISVYFGKNVEAIPANLFYGVEYKIEEVGEVEEDDLIPLDMGLEEYTLPVGVNVVLDERPAKIKEVYYDGTRQEWENISLGSNNEWAKLVQCLDDCSVLGHNVMEII
ncbi:MAG: leucine-rich repeat domain-containing protein, partial [Clostridia bacterium]|nr:leucine-rich repeat domain-containing protein [Clostridia bacterium]